MSLLPYPLHHVGIAVPNLDAAIADQQRTFGLKLEHREKLVSAGVELAFLTLANTRLELLSSLRDDSIVARFLAKRGPGLHHLCYEVHDIVAELAALRAKGVELIDTKPRPGAMGSQIAFLHPKSTGGVLIELTQEKKAGI